ncbi:hypothetical protein AGR4B_Lc70157 [Agrobacterium tumefaciens str. CFBP 5621]|nr:hypothetical protein AGR4B_Lc70157 [Agrobacterium tumefaciens str. CFBP 5621]
MLCDPLLPGTRALSERCWHITVLMNIKRQPCNKINTSVTTVVFSEIRCRVICLTAYIFT